MKKFFIYIVLVIFLACAGEKSSGPAATAKVVAESFYQGDEEQLMAHTTEEGYANFKNLMAMFAKSDNSDSNFKVIEESTEGDVAWIKYSSSYDKTPGVFKLVKQDGEWKVTARSPKEEVPF